MPLDDVPSGVTIFVDSTILHYALVQFDVATEQCIPNSAFGFLIALAERSSLAVLRSPC